MIGALLALGMCVGLVAVLAVCWPRLVGRPRIEHRPSRRPLRGDLRLWPQELRRTKDDL